MLLLGDDKQPILDLFKKYPDKIPKYDYILVDEFQDVNSTQVEFIDILSPKNLFAVGDPRQSIYGWRGSDVRFILNFEEKYENSERVALTKNYRSTKAIVDLINVSIEQMQLPNLEAVNKGEKDIRLLRFDAEPAEFEFVLQGIINAKVPKNEIFVLARTNRQLNDFSLLLKQRNISHILRNEDSEEEVMEGKVTLATVHGIKGMEAEMVFVIGCTQKNYPCKGSEHPVVDMVKVDEYDKEEEERRLFYVALSRARTYLYMSYSGKKHTYFINDKMANMVHE